MKEGLSVTGTLRKVFADSHPALKLIYLFIIMVISLLILSFLGMILAVPLFSLSPLEIQQNLDDGFIDGDLNIMRFFLTVQSVALFVIPALLANFILFRKEESFLSKKTKIKYLLPLVLILTTLLFSMPWVSWLSYLNQKLVFSEVFGKLEEELMKMEHEREVLTNRMAGVGSIGSLLVNLILMAAIPAVGEEFLFRGVLQPIFRKWTGNIHVAIAITAVVFSAVHMQFYGFLPRFFLGYYFGYIFYWTRSIWLTVGAHFLNNAVSVVLMYVFYKSGSVDSLEGEARPAWMLILMSSFVAGMCILILYQISKQRDPKNGSDLFRKPG